MQPPATPPDERRRLATLYSLGLLDRDADPELDRATRLAQKMFGTPIALVTLVDTDRQWFASNIGLGVAETSRDVSFCGHAILGDGAFVVEDAAADARFTDNPLVTDDPGIRFYAGVPIHSPDGSALGTLCVIDREPRKIAADDLSLLSDLAGLVEDVVAVRHLATRDELTGLHNRRALLEAGEHLLALADRLDQPIAMVFVDVNGLKVVNDTLGHEAGDVAIRAVGEALGASLREADIVARIGGDEFVALLPLADTDAAAAPIARFHAAIAELNATGGLGFVLAAAVGVVERQPGGLGLTALLAEADNAMYERKRLDRDG